MTNAQILIVEGLRQSAPIELAEAVRVQFDQLTERIRILEATLRDTRREIPPVVRAGGTTRQ